MVRGQDSIHVREENLRSHANHQDHWHQYGFPFKGLEIASEGLKGRVIETSLTDLKKVDQGAEKAYRKIRLVVEDVEGSSCYTNFHSMSITRDKLCSLIRKWQTTIEAYVDVKTQDDYFLRLFVIGFTTRVQRQLRATSYATKSKIKLIRKRMTEILIRAVQQNTLKTLIPILYITSGLMI